MQIKTNRHSQPMGGEQGNSWPAVDMQRGAGHMVHMQGQTLRKQKKDTEKPFKWLVHTQYCGDSVCMVECKLWAVSRELQRKPGPFLSYFICSLDNTDNVLRIKQNLKSRWLSSLNHFLWLGVSTVNYIHMWVFREKRLLSVSEYQN